MYSAVRFVPAILILLTAMSVKAEEKAMKAKMVYYSGDVQGVGFRMTTAMIARDHPVTGWVKNLSDGRVQLLVEGSPEAMEKFLKAVRERWKDNVTKEQSEDQQPTGKFKRFEVAR
jgi:acylphosphatase